MQLTLTIPKLMKWATGRNLEIQSPAGVPAKKNANVSAMIIIIMVDAIIATVADMTEDATTYHRHRHRRITDAGKIWN